MGKESEIINEFEKLFKESEVFSTVRSVVDTLTEIDSELLAAKDEKGTNGLNFDLEDKLEKDISEVSDDLFKYQLKAQKLEQMKLTPNDIIKGCKNLETKYHLFKFPFKDKLIKAVKAVDNSKIIDKKYASEVKKELDKVYGVFETVPDLLKQLG